MQEKLKPSSPLISALPTSKWGSLDGPPLWGQAIVGALYSTVQSEVPIQHQAFSYHHKANEEVRRIVGVCVGV